MYLTKARVLFVRKVSFKIKMDSQIVSAVDLGNTTIKLECLIVNLIATLDHTSHLTKLRVLFVRKVNGKIKMESQIVLVVEKENIMIKRNARQRLIARIVERENTMIKRNAWQKLIVNLIAMPDRTSYLTKVRVLFVRKVSGKIKMDGQIVSAV